MNAFRFRLERILRWRAVELSKEEKQVRELMEKEARLAKRMEDLRRERSNVENGVRAADRIDGGDLNALAGYAIHSLVQLQTLESQKLDNNRALRQQLQRYRAAKQRHRALEELRRRQFSQWQLDLASELEELAEDSFRSRSHGSDPLLQGDTQNGTGLG